MIALNTAATSQLSRKDPTFTGNFATLLGGSLFLQQLRSVSVRGCSVDGSFATQGGLAYFQRSNTVEFLPTVASFARSVVRNCHASLGQIAYGQFERVEVDVDAPRGSMLLAAVAETTSVLQRTDLRPSSLVRRDAVRCPVGSPFVLSDDRSKIGRAHV